MPEICLEYEFKWFLHIAPLRDTGLRIEACQVLLPTIPSFPLLFYPFLLSSRWIWRSTENRWTYIWNLGTTEKHSLCRKQKMIRYARPLNGPVNCSRLLCNTNRFIKWRTPIQVKTRFKRKHTSSSALMTRWDPDTPMFTIEKHLPNHLPPHTLS